MFNAKPVNDPFGDPAIYTEFMYRKEAILFDLGDIQALPPRKILKLSHIFVSHTHMDHFIGFDHLLRICLGRDKHLRLFGPPGFVKNVESKLAAYSWNLVENYENDFLIHATEIADTRRTSRKYRCRKAFRPQDGEEEMVPESAPLFEDDTFAVTFALLDHKIPSLAYRLEEKRHVNIMKNNLQSLDLPVGPWLTELKENILREAPDDTRVRVWWREGGRRIERDAVRLGILKEKAVKITPGESICYIADAIYHPENIGRITRLAKGCDHLFIEACFLERDTSRAKEKYHLTAAEAGRLAREAGVKRLTLFHFSPKYQGRGELLVQEAMEEFGKGRHSSEN